MPYSNKACIAPRKMPCGKRGHRFRLNGHYVPKCYGEYCRYLVRLDHIPEVYYNLVRPLRK